MHPLNVKLIPHHVTTRCPSIPFPRIIILVTCLSVIHLSSLCQSTEASPSPPSAHHLSPFHGLSRTSLPFLTGGEAGEDTSERPPSPSLPLRPPPSISRNHHDHRGGDIEYKTTYACDGNVLDLSCGPNATMHLVRANYGRFSLSICNEGGKLDLQVNCMSFRSYLIMQDRCAGQTKCNVSVSSDLFGDPCPGTPKYLEVQYHCQTKFGLNPSGSLSSPSPAARRPSTDNNKALPVEPPNKPPNRATGSSSSPSSSFLPSTSSSLPSPSSSNDKHDEGKHSDLNNNVFNTNNDGDSISRPSSSPSSSSSSSGSEDSSSRPTRPSHTRHGHGHGNRINSSPSGHSHHTSSPSLPSQMDVNNSNNNLRKSEGSTYSRPSSSSSSSIPFQSSKPNHKLNSVTPESFSSSSEENLNTFFTSFGSQPSSFSSSSESPLLPYSPSAIIPKKISPVNTNGAGSVGGGGSRYCPATFRRSLNWNITNPGNTLIQDCPPEAEGQASWHCSESTGAWVTGGPDLLSCRSKWIDLLYDRLEKGFQPIKIATSLANHSSGKPVYSRDLESISNLIYQLITETVRDSGTLSTRWQPNTALEELLTSLVYSVSNLLSPIQDQAWLDLVPEKRKRTAVKLIDQLEKSALLLAESTNRDGYFTVKRPNVLVAVHVLETNVPINLQFPTMEDTYDTEWIQMEDSIFLPAQSLIQYSHEGFTKAAFFAYKRVEDLLKYDPDSGSQSPLINSRIIGLAMDGFTSEKPLTQPVTLVFRHLSEEMVLPSSPSASASLKCVSWSRSSSNWSTTGCSLLSTNRTHTLCSCNQVSFYALLAEPRRPSSASPSYNPQAEDEASTSRLRLVVIIGSGISALCLLFILIILYTIYGDNNRGILCTQKDLQPINELSRVNMKLPVFATVIPTEIYV